MKPTPPELFRITADRAARVGVPAALVSDANYGRNGLFYVPRGREILRCVVSDGEGWEHVSVSLPHRCPTWEEMGFIKDVFWDSDECVMQLHPPKSDYVNNHPYCLHLWRPVAAEIPRPPTDFVGVR